MTEQQPPVVDFQKFYNQQRELIEAELKSIALKEEQLREAQKLTVAEQRRARAIEELFSSVGNLIEKNTHLVERVDQLILAISSLVSQFPAADAIRELTEEVSNRFGRTEDTQLLTLNLLQFVLPHIPDKTGQKAELARQVDRALMEPHVDSLKRQIETNRRKLDRLKEREAKFGVNVPVEIVTGIEETEDRLKELERELNECCEA